MPRTVNDKTSWCDPISLPESPLQHVIRALEIRREAISIEIEMRKRHEADAR
jgi:hypothetical protein